MQQLTSDDTGRLIELAYAGLSDDDTDGPDGELIERCDEALALVPDLQEIIMEVLSPRFDKDLVEWRQIARRRLCME